jgi:hypothetical protein
MNDLSLRLIDYKRRNVVKNGLVDIIYNYDKDLDELAIFINKINQPCKVIRDRDNNNIRIYYENDGIIGIVITRFIYLYIKNHSSCDEFIKNMNDEIIRIFNNTIITDNIDIKEILNKINTIKSIVKPNDSLEMKIDSFIEETRFIRRYRYEENYNERLCYPVYYNGKDELIKLFKKLFKNN